MFKLSKFFNNLQRFSAKHTPDILVAMGLTSMYTMAGCAIKATPKALRAIEVKKRELGTDELPLKETVKAIWKPYTPAVIAGLAGTACILGANSVHTRRNAALAAAYKISETAFTEYREKVIEAFGERKERHVRDRLDRKHLDDNPMSKSEVIITERGNTLCYDHWSGRYFRSDIDHIEKAINEINRQMLISMDNTVSLNDLYDELNLDHTPIGDTMGWRIDMGLIKTRLGSQLADDGTPCIVLDYEIAPRSLAVNWPSDSPW